MYFKTHIIKELQTLRAIRKEASSILSSIDVWKRRSVNVRSDYLRESEKVAQRIRLDNISAQHSLDNAQRDADRLESEVAELTATKEALVKEVLEMSRDLKILKYSENNTYNNGDSK